MSESAASQYNSQQVIVEAGTTTALQTAIPAAQRILPRSSRRNHPLRAAALSGTLFGALALLLGLGIERFLTFLASHQSAKQHGTLLLAALALSLLFALAPPFFAGTLASARRYGPLLGSMAGGWCYLLATLLSFAVSKLKHQSTTWQQAAALLLIQLLLGLSLGALGGQYSRWQRRWALKRRTASTSDLPAPAEQTGNPPAPASALRRLLQPFLSWCARPDVRLAFALTVALRIGCSAVALFAITVPLGPYRLVGELPLQAINHLLASPPTLTARGLIAFFSSPWEQWDTTWYVTIAALGYSGYYGRTAFLPIYPLLIHIIAVPLGGNMTAAAVVVSTIACFGLLLVLYRLAQRLGAAPSAAGACGNWVSALSPAARALAPNTARWTVIVTAFLPISFFLMAGYTESVFLWVSLGAILASLNRQWGRMALLAAIASLTRTQGLLLSLLVVPFLFDALRDWARERWAIAWLGKKMRHIAAPLLAALAGPAAYAGWTIALFLQQLPLPWEPLGSAKGWGLHFTWPGEGILADLSLLRHPTVPSTMGLAADALDAGAALLAAVLIVMAARRAPPALTIYAVCTWCLALTKVLPDGETMSAARYLLPLAPLAVLAGAWLARHHPAFRLAWVAVACVPLMFFTWYFISIGWVN